MKKIPPADIETMGKIIHFIFLFFAILSCGVLPNRYPNSVIEVKHVVFDIDWTITSEVEANFQGKRIIEVEGKKYFVHDGLEELIESLISKPDIRVSFFSGGSMIRNHTMLQKIKLHDGRSLEDIAFKILNFNDLTPISTVDSKEKFSNRYKKDLTKISKDLKNLIMIDDTEHFVLDTEQEKHVFSLGKTFNHFEKFEDSISLSGEYIPRSYGEWSLAKNKLHIIQSALDVAFNDTQEETWSAAVKSQERQLDFSRGDWNDYSRMLYQKSFLQKASSHKSCLDLIQNFIP